MHFLDVTPELEPMRTLLGEALARVERRVADALRSDEACVQQLCDHLAQYHGKMVRPMLAVLAGVASNPRAPDDATTLDRLVTVGAVCEMVHLATLVHDDVLDEADIRRKTQTVNRLVGNEAAVILGDYVFSAAFRLCATLNDQTTTERIGLTGMRLCAGELLQLTNRGNLALDERSYFRIVEGKTASLIAASASLGARHAGAASAAEADRWTRFGTALGTAFQIQDDLLDLTGDSSVVGKPLGKDAALGKLTLPVIHHLGVAGPESKLRTLRLIESSSSGVTGGASVGGMLVSALRSTDSIAYARGVAARLVKEATAELAPLAESPAKRLLQLMADAVVSRTM